MDKIMYYIPKADDHIFVIQKKDVKPEMQASETQIMSFRNVHINNLIQQKM